MLRPSAILLLSLVVSLAADVKPQREDFRRRATVLKVVTLADYSGAFMSVGDVDPEFAVTVRMASITPSLVKFTKGATVTFAIHSPAQLFGAENAQGKTYNFILRRETVNGRTSFSSLRVREKSS